MKISCLSLPPTGEFCCPATAVFSSSAEIFATGNKNRPVCGRIVFVIGEMRDTPTRSESDKLRVSVNSANRTLILQILCRMTAFIIYDNLMLNNFNLLL